MTNLDSIFKSRDLTLPTKFRLVKAMVFPVVMYGCELDCEEGWAPKNWCIWTVALEKTLESPLDCKEINPGISLEGMMLRLKLQYFGHLMQELTHWKRVWCWEGLGAGGEGDDRGWDGWMASLTWWTFESEWTLGVGDGQGGLACWDSWGCKESDTTERLNWNELKGSSLSEKENVIDPYITWSQTSLLRWPPNHKKLFDNS